VSRYWGNERGETLAFTWSSRAASTTANEVREEHSKRDDRERLRAFEATPKGM